VCRGFTDQPASTARISVDIGDGASPVLVDTFGYLGDMLSIDGDADGAVEALEYKQDGLALDNSYICLPIRMSPF